MTAPTMLVHMVGGTMHGTGFEAPFGTDGLPQPHADVHLGEVWLPIIDDSLEALIAGQEEPKASVEVTRVERYVVDLGEAHFGNNGQEHHVYRFAGVVDQDTGEVVP